jgi:hypothetical protein
MIMNRMVVSPSVGLGLRAGLPDGFDRLYPCSTCTTNGEQQNRQAQDLFCKYFLFWQFLDFLPLPGHFYFLVLSFQPNARLRLHQCLRHEASLFYAPS